MSIKFDGNEYLNSGDLFYSDALTISVRVKPDVIDANARTILVKRNIGITGNSNEWSLTVSDTGVSFTSWNSSEQSTGTVKGAPIPVGVRTRIGVVVPANGKGSAKMYYNGVLVATGVAKTSAMRNTNSGIQVGNRSNNDNNRYFKGEISALGIWNLTVAAADMVKLGKDSNYTGNPNNDPAKSISPANLQLYLPMIGTAGQTVHQVAVSDISGKNRVFTGAGTTPGLTYQTEPFGDTTAPTVPTNLIGNAVSQSQINLSWNFASDNVGVTGYRIYRGGIQIATTTSTSYQDKNLTPNTNYTYYVRSYDAAGNVSGNSNMVTVKTLQPDTQPPATPEWLVAEQGNTGEIIVSADIPGDNVGTIGIEFLRGADNGNWRFVAAPNNTYTYTGLPSGQAFGYTVRAVDAAGNRSEPFYPPYIIITP